MLLGTLAANLLRSSYNRKRTNKSRWKCLMPPHPVTNFEIQKYQNESKFNGVYSRNDLSKIKDGRYIIKIYEYESIGTHWIALHGNAKNVT